VAATPAAAEVQLVIRNGRVSLTANGATLREILEEWERVGQTRIINADRVASEPLTLQLPDVSEEQALAVLLRSVSGYLAAPRPVPDADASRFDRIMIMPGSARPRPAAPPQAPAFEPPSFDPPLQPLPEPDLQEQNDAEPVRIVPPPNPRGPVFNAFPPVQTTPQQTEPPARAPSQPVYGVQPVVTPGVAVPGMMMPAPAEQDRSESAQPGS
jgi:hypothetical protein